MWEPQKTCQQAGGDSILLPECLRTLAHEAPSQETPKPQQGAFVWSLAIFPFGVTARAPGVQRQHLALTTLLRPSSRSGGPCSMESDSGNTVVTISRGHS